MSSRAPLWYDADAKAIGHFRRSPRQWRAAVPRDSARLSDVSWEHSARHIRSSAGYRGVMSRRVLTSFVLLLSAAPLVAQAPRPAAPSPLQEGRW